jgi:hypothetical protein
VDVDAKEEKYGETALYRVARNGHEAVVRLLEPPPALLTIFALYIRFNVSDYARIMANALQDPTCVDQLSSMLHARPMPIVLVFAITFCG